MSPPHRCRPRWLECVSLSVAFSPLYSTFRRRKSIFSCRSTWLRVRLTSPWLGELLAPQPRRPPYSTHRQRCSRPTPHSCRTPPPPPPSPPTPRRTPPNASLPPP